MKKVRTSVNSEGIILNYGAIERIGLKIVIQAIRDFAFPKLIEKVYWKVVKMDKNDPTYKDDVNRIFRRERKKIIKDLKSDFLVGLTNGRSEEVASKLQAILDDKTGNAMKILRKNVRSSNNNEED